MTRRDFIMGKHVISRDVQISPETMVTVDWNCGKDKKNGSTILIKSVKYTKSPQSIIQVSKSRQFTTPSCIFARYCRTIQPSGAILCGCTTRTVIPTSFLLFNYSPEMITRCYKSLELHTHLRRRLCTRSSIFPTPKRQFRLSNGVSCVWAGFQPKFGCHQSSWVSPMPWSGTKFWTLIVLYLYLTEGGIKGDFWEIHSVSVCLNLSIEETMWTIWKETVSIRPAIINTWWYSGQKAGFRRGRI